MPLQDTYAPLDKRYPLLVEQGAAFVKAMGTDGSFSRRSMNELAVELMLIGWIYAQPWFERMRAKAMKRHARENVYLVVRDFALQAATDVFENASKQRRSKKGGK